MTYEKTLEIVDRLRNIKQFLKYTFGAPDKEGLKKNAQLKGALQGKRCFILGNGPSLKEQDLSLLKGEFVMTVNQAAKNGDFYKFNTSVHFWADPGFFKTDNATDELIRAMKSVKTEHNNPKAFYPLFAKDFVEKYALDKVLDIHYFAPMYIFHNNYKNDIDFCKGVPGFYTVVQYAIVLALYMGASEIYLLGCDCTGIISYISTVTENVNAAYAYEVTEKEKKRMKKMLGAERMENHFLSDYHNIQNYRLLGKYCEERNVKLVNCTAGGILTELPREKFEDVVAHKIV